MNQQERADATASDETLILQARGGDRSAFAELWTRHARSGLKVARGFTSSLEAEDLVAEAYTRIFQRVLDGGGPDGAFRPYLYTTIRNLASRWGGARKDIQIEDIEDIEDTTVLADAPIEALDRSLTVRAFRDLPERWQSVLWYTEIEGMDPHEVAPILGMTANGVAALAYRAREGLRKAWLQAHVTMPGRTDDCRWCIQRLGDKARNSLSDREHARLGAHLSACVSCSIVAEEVDDVGSRLAFVMLPLLLGATVGGTLLASLGAPSSATAASLATLPTVPPAFEVASLSSVPMVSAGLGASAVLGKSVLVGALAVSLAVGGGIASSVPPTAADSSHSASAPELGSNSTTGSGADSSAGDSGVNAQTDPATGDPSQQTSPSGPLSDLTDPVAALVNDVLAPVTSILPISPGPTPEHVAPDGVAGAVVDLDLFGKGMPKAVVSAQVAGEVYTTVVAKDGTWAIHLTALPDGVGPITLKQRLTVLGIPVPIDIPLSLLSDTLGITVDLLN